MTTRNALRGILAILTLNVLMASTAFSQSGTNYQGSSTIASTVILAECFYLDAKFQPGTTEWKWDIPDTSFAAQGCKWVDGVDWEDYNLPGTQLEVRFGADYNGNSHKDTTVQALESRSRGTYLVDWATRNGMDEATMNVPSNASLSLRKAELYVVLSLEFKQELCPELKLYYPADEPLYPLSQPSGPVREVAGDANADGDFDAEDCREHIRLMTPKPALPQVIPGPCDYLKGEFTVAKGYPVDGDYDRDGDYDAEDCSAYDIATAQVGMAARIKDMVRIGLQVGWTVGSFRQVQPDNGLSLSLYGGLDINHFWFEVVGGGGIDVREPGKEYQRPWHIRGSFAVGPIFGKNRHTVRLGFGLATRTTGPHIISADKMGGGGTSLLVGDGSNRAMGLVKVAWQPIPEAASWHFQLFAELNLGAVEFATGETIQSEFGWAALVGVRVGFF